MTTSTPRRPPSPRRVEETARNRINQRNFRTRRLQYIQELEDKLRAYDQAGVQATTSVQAAARQVVRENAVLRQMLRDTTGWAEEQVNAHVEFALRGEWEDGGLRRDSSLGYIGLQGGDCGMRTTDCGDRKMVVDAGTDVKLPPPPDCVPWVNGGPSPYKIQDVFRSDPRYHDIHPSPASITNKDSTALNGNNNINTNTNTSINNTARNPPDPSLSTPTPLNAHNPSPPPPLSISPHTNPHTPRTNPSMSCEEAAAIISSISVSGTFSHNNPNNNYSNSYGNNYGGGVDQNIRAQLGCSSTMGPCSVDHGRVFQVMGDTI